MHWNHIPWKFMKFITTCRVPTFTSRFNFTYDNAGTKSFTYWIPISFEFKAFTWASSVSPNGATTISCNFLLTIGLSEAINLFSKTNRAAFSFSKNPDLSSLLSRVQASRMSLKPEISLKIFFFLTFSLNLVTDSINLKKIIFLKKISRHLRCKNV